MNLVRVYKNPDGTVSVIHPSPRARREISRAPDADPDKPDIVVMESDEDFLDRVSQKAVKGTFREGADFVDKDISDLPTNRADRNKWRWQAGGQGIRVDLSVILPREAKAALEAQLDAELAKPSPDTITAMRLQRRLDKRDF